MRLLVSGVAASLLLVGFVFTWIYLASQGQVPVIQAPLEGVDASLRFVVLVVLAIVIGLVYRAVSPRSTRSG